MDLENESMNKESMETIDRFISDAIEYIRKKNEKRANEPTIIDYVFNKNSSVNADREIVEKRITFRTTSGMLENKTNGNKNSFQVKDQAKLASGDIVGNTPAPLKIFNTPLEAQVTDLLEESITEDSNRNHLPRIEEHDLRDLITTGEQINNLKKETVTLREFILEQLYVVKKVRGRPEKPTGVSRKFALVRIHKGGDILPKSRKQK